MHCEYRRAAQLHTDHTDNMLNTFLKYIPLACLLSLSWYAGHISTAQVDEFLNGQPPPASTETAGTPQGSGHFFDRIASTYDLLNELISLGYQTTWRHAAISRIIPSSSVLDVATGTGDIALAVSAQQPQSRVVGVDPSEGMLELAAKKVKAAGARIGDVELVKGTAEQLAFEKDSFDAVIVAFGVRNFEDRVEGLRQIARVLAANGRFVILEASTPKKKSTPLYMLSRVVLNVVLSVAGVISGDVSAYRYLLNSMDSFPHKDQFIEMLEQAGFDVVEYSRMPPLGFGPELYVAIKRDAPPVASPTEAESEASEDAPSGDGPTDESVHSEL